MIQVVKRGKAGFVSILTFLVLLAGCNQDENSFRTLNLQATATGDETVEQIPVKVMVVGDSVSPRLSGFLNGRTFESNNDQYAMQVTNVPYVDYEARDVAMDGDYIVWSDDRNGNLDIYGYQISTATEFPISTAAGSQHSPKVSGDYVVWQDNRNGNDDIYAYQFSTNTEFAITTAAQKQRYPQIDGDYVVWQDERNGGADIYAYQISTSSELSISTQAGVEEWEPQVSGDYIVWQSYDNGFSDIHGYRISTASQFVVSQANGGQDMPALSDDYVVWVDNRNGNDDIYAYKLATGQEILVSSAAGIQWRPQVAGDYVVWQDYRNGNYDIYAYHFSSASEIVVSINAAAQTNPVIKGDYIAWQDFRSGNDDVFAYRISTAEEIRISDHSSAQNQPVLSNNGIAWLDTRRGLVDVMFREQVTGQDQLATTTWSTPAGAVNTLADDYKVVILGSDLFSDEIMLDVFDTAINANVNVLGIGGTGTSLAKALATAGRYGMSVTPGSGCSPTELIADVSSGEGHEVFTDLNISVVLTLETNRAEIMDELAIETDASNSNSPQDWQVLATYSGNMCNAAAPAFVEFGTGSGNGVRVLLDGSAGVADDYRYWNNDRWSLLANSVSYLARQVIEAAAE